MNHAATNPKELVVKNTVRMWNLVMTKETLNSFLTYALVLIWHTDLSFVRQEVVSRSFRKREDCTCNKLGMVRSSHHKNESKLLMNHH